jgi:uncharacterized sulfatase
MQRRQVLQTLASGAAALSLHSVPGAAQATAKPPNIIFVLADDLGYGDLGCYGQKVIQTPHLDRMAAEGLRFTQFYAGNTVCAPSRSVLMTGRHMGHTHVRGNASSAGNMIIQSLRETDVTVAETLKKAGYSTALIGKWGLGEIDQPGHPLNKGFDYFYGYLNQVHAHNYWPDFLWRNREQVKLSNVVQKASRAYGGFHGGWSTTKNEYAPDLFMKEALSWIDSHKSGPFFLYLALTSPHANNEGGAEQGNGSEVPSLGAYANAEWPEPDKGQAAMIAHLDQSVGRLLDHLAKLNLSENTLVMFSSDNGPHMESRHNPLRFNPSGPLRGMKRDLYEGGIRVPCIARWPGTIQPNRTSDHIAYFGDMMATFTELARTQPPAGVDSVSFVPTLMGQTSKQRKAEYLYWEFYEGGSAQAVRWGKWKGIRKPMRKGPIELYDLSLDPGEKYNVARGHQEVVKRIQGFMDAAHVPHPNWTVS